MPTIPKQTKDIKSFQSADILNGIRAEADDAYRNAVPKAIKPGDVLPNGNRATQADALASLREIGSTMLEYEVIQNTFARALVNRIARVMITSKLYRNPLSRFKKGILEYGETVEEIFVNMAQVYQYDPCKEGSTVFKRHFPNMEAAYHTINYQKYYPITISFFDLRQAFLSYTGITDLISRIIEQVYTAANYDEFLVTKYLLAKCTIKGYIYPIQVPPLTDANARSITAMMVEQAGNLQFMSTQYNRAGVRTSTDPAFLWNILTPRAKSIFDVEVLALSFNMTKADLIGHQILIDDFTPTDEARLAQLFADDPYTKYVPFTKDEKTLLKSIQSVMLDEHWFMMFDNLNTSRGIQNPEDLYTNYFYHTWKIISSSPFANALMFVTSDSTVTGMTLEPNNGSTDSPATVNASKGQRIMFVPTVSGTGFVSQAVTWTVSGNSSGNTIMESTGFLNISCNETAETLTVTATSVQNPEISATATVTLS